MKTSMKKILDAVTRNIWLQVLVLIAALCGLALLAGASFKEVTATSKGLPIPSEPSSLPSSSEEPEPSSRDEWEEFLAGSGAFGDWENFSSFYEDPNPNPSTDPPQPSSSSPEESSASSSEAPSEGSSAPPSGPPIPPPVSSEGNLGSGDVPSPGPSPEGPTGPSDESGSPAPESSDTSSAAPGPGPGDGSASSPEDVSSEPSQPSEADPSPGPASGETSTSSPGGSPMDAIDPNA